MSVFRFKTHDGRNLRYYDNQNLGGEALLFFHGFPGSYEQAMLLDSTKKNIRLISFDRPGIGGSDLTPNGTLNTFAQDIAELIEHLKIKSVRLIGVSGGAPYALACALALKNKVTSMALVCPLGPLAEPEVFSQMPAKTQKLFKIALNHPKLTSIIMNGFRHYFIRRPRTVFNKMKSRYSEKDFEVLEHNHLASALIGSYLTAFEQGSKGLMLDLKNYLNDWPFDLTQIDIPTSVWHGTADQVVPSEIGSWLAKKIPGSKLNLIKGHGHYSLPYVFREDILKDLLGENQNGKSKTDSPHV